MKARSSRIVAVTSLLFLFCAAESLRGAENAADKSKTPDANAAAEQKALARTLIRKYRSEYRKFTSGLIQTKSRTPAERIAFLKKSNAAINAVFKDHIKSPVMAVVLPELEDALGIDLEPTLTAVASNNPRPEISSVAIYVLAVHLHKTKRAPKLVEKLLVHTQKNLANVPYKKTTLGKAAKESLYRVQTLSVGMTAPDVSGTDADGVKFKLSDYHGKVIVLRFWGDWCPFCRAMFPQERDLVNKLRDKPFALIGVNSDSRARLKKAQREKSLVWRSFWDGGNVEGPIAGTYRVSEWPTIFVIDHHGIIRRWQHHAAWLGAAYNPVTPVFVGRGSLEVGSPSIKGTTPILTRFDPWDGVTPESSFRFDGTRLPQGVDMSRFHRRRSLLQRLGASQPVLGRRATTFHRYRDLAFAMIANPKVAQALDVTREPRRVRDKYGMTLFGQSALSARRLVESGVKVTTVFWDTWTDNNAAWDTHHNHYPRLKQGLLPKLDRILPAFLDDLQERGLLDETLVMVISEHGRTPVITKTVGAGREHWSGAYWGMFFGAGIKTGQVIGATDRSGGFPISRPTDPKDILATMYHLLGFDPYQTTIPDRFGRPIHLIPHGNVVHELLL
eukprot:g12528.t1